ncbi:MAG: hypothetical protein Q9167_006301 [Letrouitia subvulpina]
MDDAKLEVLDTSVPQNFFAPIKKINEGHDVSRFLTSKAYRDVMTFVLQLNRAMFPCIIRDDANETKTHIWELEPSDVTFSDTVVRLRELLEELNGIIDEVPPDPGPRRFGNVSFRRWYDLVEERITVMLESYLPSKVLSFNSQTNMKAQDELQSYLLGSFGSSQRLDYGTGHELSFLAFLGCIWKLGGFDQSASGNEERGIVLGVFQSYLQLTRRLIQTYTLEPAGSHGVWGLDDHFFLPYLFGSAQYGPVLSSSADITPIEGSRADAPDAGDVVKKAVVETERTKNMYFSAIGFIYDVKKGPFWEHSPILYDISGVRAGWAKINKGMIKMFMAEVLSKFPVVQHFYFGTLFGWEQDPMAVPPPKSAHSMNQPAHGDLKSLKSDRKGPSAEGSSNLAQQRGTRAPWASKSTATPNVFVGTAAPWARQPSATDPTMAFPNRNSQQPPASLSSMPRDMEPNKPGSQGMPPPTRAPWAKDGEC